MLLRVKSTLSSIGSVSILAASVTAFAGNSIQYEAGASQLNTPNAQSIVQYEAGWFKRFAPNTAADILQAVPAFSVRTSEAERGIGRINENVLVNGQPIKGKGASAQALLQQIPASAVVQVRVGDASQFDVTGVSGLIADVVLKQQTFQGTLTWSPEFRHYANERISNGSLFVSGELETITYSLGIKNDAWREGDKLVQNIFDKNQQPIALYDGKEIRDGDKPTLLLDVTKTLSEKYRIGTNISIASSEFNSNFDSNNNSFNGNREIFNSITDEEGFSSALTLRLTQELNDSTLDIVAFHSYDDLKSRNYSASTLQNNGALIKSRVFNLDTESQEAILQGVYRLGESSDFWEFSAEYAYNYLDANGLSGSSTSIFEPTLQIDKSSSGEVEENRTEFMLSRRIPLNKWSFDIAIGAEHSEIGVLSLAGVSDNKQNFFRPKGALAISFAFNTDQILRASLERSVSQLDFLDFLGSQNFQLNLSSGANTELIPSQSWLFATEMQTQFGKKSTYSIRFEYDRIDDIVDKIVVDGKDAIGNIGHGERWGIKSNLTWRPQIPALKQWQLNLTNEFYHTELTDPLTNQKRSFSEGREWFYLAEASYELRNRPITIGVKLEQWHNSDVFRSNEIFTYNTNRPQFVFSLKHADFFGVNMTVELVNLLDHHFVRERQVYAGLRETSEINNFEHHESSFSPFLHMKLQKNF